MKEFRVDVAHTSLSLTAFSNQETKSLGFLLIILDLAPQKRNSASLSSMLISRGPRCVRDAYAKIGTYLPNLTKSPYLIRKPLSFWQY